MEVNNSPDSITSLLERVEVAKSGIVQELFDLKSLLGEQGLSVDIAPVIKSMDTMLDPLDFFRLLTVLKGNKNLYLLQKDGLALLIEIDDSLPLGNRLPVRYRFNDRNKVFTMVNCYADIDPNQAKYRFLAKELITSIKLERGFYFDPDQDMADSQLLTELPIARQELLQPMPTSLNKALIVDEGYTNTQAPPVGVQFNPQGAISNNYNQVTTPDYSQSQQVTPQARFNPDFSPKKIESANLNLRLMVDDEVSNAEALAELRQLESLRSGGTGASGYGDARYNKDYTTS